MEPVEIGRGIPPGQHQKTAALYWTAFGSKFRPALGNGDGVVPFLAHRLRPDQFLCALAGGRVVGALGFYLGGSGAIDLSHRALTEQYSWSSAWARMLLLAPLGRRPRERELVLDGICVDGARRGQGIGTRLLDAAAELAVEQVVPTIRLSVIDTNPRARALYERSGYRPVGTEHLGPLAPIYGFR